MGSRASAATAALLICACQAGHGRAQSAAAEGQPTSPSQACGIALGQPALSEWIDYGGEGGRLGCPTQPEAASLPSASGVRSLTAVFDDRGVIITHVSGPLAGHAFVVFGCAWRLFFQFGGAGGTLGLPKEDPRNTPDGQVQAFEGGLIRATRAYDSCEIVRPGED